MQRQHQRAAAVECGLGAADFRHAGQERQDVAGVLGQRGADGSGDRVREVAWVGDVARGVGDGYTQVSFNSQPSRRPINPAPRSL